MYEGGRDNYAHYFISKYAWKYPELFFDHWGKPVYTLLTSPFARFGLHGIIFFNCFTGIITAFLVYKILLFLKFRKSQLPVIFLLFSPMYFVLMISAMTEVLGAFTLVLSIYFFLQKRFAVGAIVFSVILLIRTETFVFFPIAILYLLSLRKYSCIPLIFTFPVLYSIAGFLVHNDLLWLVTKNPYSGVSDIYGTGSIWHFIVRSPDIFGWPFLVFLAVGLLVIMYQMLNGVIKDSAIRNTLALITVLWITLLAAHSYAYWKGGKASLGLVRVLVTVLPLAAITAGKGVEFFFGLIPERQVGFNRFMSILAAAVLSFIQFFQPWMQLPIPFSYDEQDKVLMTSLDWLNKHRYIDNRIIYFDLFVPYHLQIDPYDTLISREGVRQKTFPENDTKTGDIVVFDTRFAPNEGGVKLSSFMENSSFRLLQYFEPIVPIFTLNNLPYGVYIFKRISPTQINNFQRLDSIKKTKFTNIVSLVDTTFIPVHQSSEFISLYEGHLDDSFHELSPNILQIGFDFEHHSGDLSKVGVCISFDKGDSIVSFYSFPIENLYHTKVHNQFIGKTEDADKIKIFLWNMGRADLKLSLKNIQIFFSKKIY